MALPPEGAAATAAAQDFMLDLRHLARPVSPFRDFADKLNAASYPNQKAIDLAVRSRDWLARLALEHPGVQHTDPVLNLAAVRIACSGTDRAWLEDVIRRVDASIAASGAPQAAPATNLPPERT